MPRREDDLARDSLDIETGAASRGQPRLELRHSPDSRRYTQRVTSPDERAFSSRPQAGPRPIKRALLMMKPASRDNGSLRRVFSRLLAVLLVAALGAGAYAQSEPASQLRAFYGALLSTMRNGPSLGTEGRYTALKPVIARNFDLPYMARRAVGPAWASTSIAEQQEITEAFWRYTTATYANRFDHYSGQQFQLLGQTPSGPDVIVRTRIVRADGTTTVINYLMHRTGNDWRIADVYLEGTVSELAVRRSEFSSVIRQQGMGGLIARLDQKAKEFTSGAAK